MEGYLSGSELHRAIAKAIDEGKGPEIFRVKTGNKWIIPSSWVYIISKDQKCLIRYVGSIRSITDQNGIVWEWPQPYLWEKPKNGQTIYIPAIGYKEMYRETQWSSSVPNNLRLLRLGFIHSTAEAAIAHGQAMAAASSGRITAE